MTIIQIYLLHNFRSSPERSALVGVLHPVGNQADHARRETVAGQLVDTGAQQQRAGVQPSQQHDLLHPPQRDEDVHGVRQHHGHERKMGVD